MCDGEKEVLCSETRTEQTTLCGARGERGVPNSGRASFADVPRNPKLVIRSKGRRGTNLPFPLHLLVTITQAKPEGRSQFRKMET